MNFKKLPTWFLQGIFIFPFLILISVVFFFLTFGEFNILFWLVVPSIIFEEIFEGCCYTFSNNYLANLIFALIFWFVIGVLIGRFSRKLNKD